MENKKIDLSQTALQNDPNKILFESALLGRIDSNTDPIVRRTLFEIGGKRSIRFCNLSFVTGQGGAGKSMVISLIVSQMLHCNVHYFKSDLTQQDIILWIDTEQDQEDTKEIFDRIERTSGRSSQVVMIPLQDFKKKDRLAILPQLIEHYKAQLVIVDGLTDLMNNPNDIEESSALIELLSKFSKQYMCHIMSVIHQNEGSGANFNDKARGHLGSEAHRKGETLMAVSFKKKEQHHEVRTMKHRRGYWEPFSFTYDQELQAPVFKGVIEVGVSNQEKKSILEGVRESLSERIEIVDRLYQQAEKRPEKGFKTLQGDLRDCLGGVMEGLYEVKLGKTALDEVRKLLQQTKEIFKQGDLYKIKPSKQQENYNDLPF